MFFGISGVESGHLLWALPQRAREEEEAGYERWEELHDGYGYAVMVDRRRGFTRDAKVSGLGMRGCRHRGECRTLCGPSADFEQQPVHRSHSCSCSYSSRFQPTGSHKKQKLPRVLRLNFNAAIPVSK